MKNIEKWTQKRFQRDSKGRIKGIYNHKIIGNAYEPVIRNNSKGKLLDLGCGDVPYFHMYKDSVDEVICIDWGNSSLDISHLDIEADLNLGLPMIESETFDTIICTDVFEHIYNPELLFNELGRVLKPSGKLILAVPFLYWIHSSPHDHHRYTHFKLRNFCESRGLEVLSLASYGGLPEIIFDLIYKGYNFYNLPFKGVFLKLFFNLGYFLKDFSFVKRMSDKSKETFPLGYILVAQKK